MGMTIEEYLKERQACNDCESTNNQEYCVTHMLSRPDNCMIYNSIIYNSYPADNEDINLLKNLRATPGAEQLVLEYYLRSEPIVKKIREVHYQSPAVWDYYYFTYVKDIIDDLRKNSSKSAMDRIFKMLSVLEKEVLNLQ